MSTTTRAVGGAPPPPAGTRPAGQGQARTVTARPARRSLRSRLRRDWPLLLMTAPTIVLLLVFHYIPLLGNVIAFEDYSPFTGVRGSPFIGFANFGQLFGDPLFWHATLNTLRITLFQLVFYFPVPIALALLLHSLLSTRLRTVLQSIVYLPHFFSWVLVVTLFQQIVGGAGVLDQFLRRHDIGSFDAMTNPHTFILLVTSQAVWKDAGWGAIVFLAVLSTVDMQLYEAAAVDGAGRWRRLWHITLPALRPVIILLLILRLGDALTVGFEQFLLQRAAVGPNASEVLDTYTYYTGVAYGHWGVGAAAGLLKGVVGLVLVLAANKVAHLFGEQGVYSRR